MVEQKGYGFLLISANGDDCTCHTVGNLVQLKVAESNVSSLDGKPFGIQPYDLFVAVWDGLFDFFFSNFIKRIAHRDPIACFGSHLLMCRVQARCRCRKTDKSSLVIPIFLIAAEK